MINWSAPFKSGKSFCILVAVAFFLGLVQEWLGVPQVGLINIVIDVIGAYVLLALVAHSADRKARTATRTLGEAEAPAPATRAEACTILGVTPGCTPDELTKAYHKKVSEWHPDKLGHMAAELKEYATKEVARINEAYATLKSPLPKARRFEEGNAGTGAAEHSSPAGRQAETGDISTPPTKRRRSNRIIWVFVLPGLLLLFTGPALIRTASEALAVLTAYNRLQTPDYSKVEAISQSPYPSVELAQLLKGSPPHFTTSNDQGDPKLEVQGRSITDIGAFDALPSMEKVTCSRNGMVCRMEITIPPARTGDRTAVRIKGSDVFIVPIVATQASLDALQGTETFDYQITKWELDDDWQPTAKTTPIGHQIEAVRTDPCGQLTLVIDLVTRSLSEYTVQLPGGNGKPCNTGLPWKSHDFLVDSDLSTWKLKSPTPNPGRTVILGGDYVDTPLAKRQREDATRELQESVERARQQMGK